MSRWVDVRVPRDDAARAMIALLASHGAPINFSIDFNPPAAGPEAEVSVEDIAEDKVRRAIEEQGILVLATRTRIAETAGILLLRQGDTTVKVKLPDDPESQRLALQAMERQGFQINPPGGTTDG